MFSVFVRFVFFTSYVMFLTCFNLTVFAAFTFLMGFRIIFGIDVVNFVAKNVFFMET